MISLAGRSRREEERVEIALNYRGPLPNSRSNGAKLAKTRIRQQLHHQFDGLCRNSDLFRDALRDDLAHATIKSGDQRAEVSGAPYGSFYIVEFRGGVQFVPLLSRWNRRVCELTVQLWRRADPGEILDPGGDVDNRVKTLFDGLRIPHSEDEIHPTAGTFGRCFCLLEDDALITKLTISTHKMYRPIEGDEDTTYAELNMYVTVKATFPSVSNMPLSLV